MATALIAGALGVVGRALVEHLENDPEWDVIGLSRRSPDFETSANFISVDLLNLSDCKEKLTSLTNVSHVFFTPYSARESFADEVLPNLEMLKNLMTVIEETASKLQHVQLMLGAKWYGVQFGAPYKPPAKESDPRHMPPNFYYNQLDWLTEKQKGCKWTWSALLPHGIWGFSVGSEMNMLTSLAVYASISKHYGIPLNFPGNPDLYHSVYQIVDVSLLSRAMVWAATTPTAANEAFNITNGDFTRWCHLWPRIADFFEMEVGEIRQVNLQSLMSDKENVWKEICDKHNLNYYKMNDLATWRFMDYAFNNGFDQMSCLNKIRNAGWNGLLDTEETITLQLKNMRNQKIIP